MIGKWLTKVRDKFLGINKLEYRIGRRNEALIDSKFKELKAIELLKGYFPQGFVFESTYSLSFQTIQHIANDIIVNRPATILEIGSGLSTIVLSKVIKETGYKAEFFSVDQDRTWQDHLKMHCDNVNFYQFEIGTSGEFAMEGSNWFDIPLDSILRTKKYDLVIVDGPKGSESRLARYGIVDFLRGRLTETAIVFVDDTDREYEKVLLWHLRDMMPFRHCETFYRYSRLSNDNRVVTSPS
jgi:hypothetical protein